MSRSGSTKGVDLRGTAEDAEEDQEGDLELFVEGDDQAQEEVGEGAGEVEEGVEEPEGEPLLVIPGVVGLNCTEALDASVEDDDGVGEGKLGLPWAPGAVCVYGVVRRQDGQSGST